MKSDIFVSKAGDPRQSISWLLDKVGIPSNLERICIKANLNDYRKWETASTSDPYLLDALLFVLKDKCPSASITILENDATGVNADNIFRYLGIDAVVKKHGCQFSNVGRNDWVNVNIDGLHFKQMEVPSILKECDYFITFPKLKSHVITKMTCSLKNQMGLFRPKRKVAYHHLLTELIVDCNLAMRANISLVDANLVMEGNYGPTYGSPRKLGLLICSKDLVAVDSLSARLFGLDPKSIGYIKKATQRGLGSTKFKIDSDFDFNMKDYRLKFNPFLFYAIRKISGGMKK